MRPPRRCRKRQTNKSTRAGLKSARPVLYGGRRTRPRSSVLPYGQNLDAGAIHLPRAGEKKWGPRRVLTRWGGRTSRRPGEGHDGTPERAQRKRVAMGKEEQGSGMRNSRQAVPKRADFATTRRCRTRQTNQVHKDRAEISPVLFCGRTAIMCRRGDSYERRSALSAVG